MANLIEKFVCKFYNIHKFFLQVYFEDCANFVFFTASIGKCFWKFKFPKIAAPKLTAGGANNFFKSTLLLSASSFVMSRNSWLAALCSAGKRFGQQVMSSRKLLVNCFSRSSNSKSCECFDTQCRRTRSTLIVAAVDITDSLRRFLSLHEFVRLHSGSLSRGLLDADVAMAKAVKADDVLLLKIG